MTTAPPNPIDPRNTASPASAYDPADHLALYRFKVLTEIKDEVVEWARVRLGILATLLSLGILTGSYFGIHHLVEGHMDNVGKSFNDKIKTMEDTGQQAKERIEALKYQSDSVNRLSFEAERELNRLKGEADRVRQFVQETEEKVKGLDQQTKKLRDAAEIFKDNNREASQYLHEQVQKARADILRMNNNVELLHSGFSIIEKLASEIRQKDPQSELARQFAGFGAQWRESKALYEKRAALIQTRRDTKVIFYLREKASQQRKDQAEEFVAQLRKEGYTAESWVTSKGLDELGAVKEVGGEFGLDPKALLRPVLVLSPASQVSIEDLGEIAAATGVKLPAVSRQEITPNPDRKSLIQGGGENGGFKSTSIVLIAQLGDE